MMHATPPWIRALPVLGVGLGLRKSLARQIMAHREAIDFLEVIIEHYLEPSAAQRRELSALRRAFPLIPHGLGLSLGSASPAEPEYLDDVAAVIRTLCPPWWSEHVAMTRAARLDIGHLAPLPYTNEMVEVVCRNIAQMKRRTGVPLILENIAYTHQFARNELTEAAFLTRILERSDCGLLLDVMNLYANSRNHHYDPVEFLEAIPLERVVQVHVIGGHWERGLLVDSHSSAAPREVWELLCRVAERTQIKAVLVEWDEHLPPFEMILNELAIARDIMAGTRKPVAQETADAVG